MPSKLGVVIFFFLKVYPRFGLFYIKYIYLYQYNYYLSLVLAKNYIFYESLTTYLLLLCHEFKYYLYIG